MSMGEASGSSGPATEPPQWVVLLLTAGMGAVGGAVLSFAQWLVLRKKAHPGRNLDPCQHAGLDVRHAAHLLGHRHGIQDVHRVAVWSC